MTNEERLESLLRQRWSTQRDQEELNATLTDINDRIRKVLKKMGVRKYETPLGTVMVVRNKTYDWDTERIMQWYVRKKMRPPFKQEYIFQPDKLEKDINKGKVDQEMLEVWCDIKKGKPYVKVIQAVKK
jgi:hypothetical protein